MSIVCKNKEKIYQNLKSTSRSSRWNHQNSKFQFQSEVKRIVSKLSKISIPNFDGTNWSIEWNCDKIFYNFREISRQRVKERYGRVGSWRTMEVPVRQIGWYGWKAGSAIYTVTNIYVSWSVMVYLIRKFFHINFSKYL